MSDSSYQRLITPVHPVFHRSFTVGDCYDIAAITGLNVQDITGIIIGRTKPNDVIAERLQPYFGKEIIDQLIHDYDPYRFYEYTTISDKKKFRFFKDIQVHMLTVGSCIYTNDNKWIKLSHIESNETMTTLYSGGAHIGRFNNNTFFKAMVPKHERKNNIHSQQLNEAEKEQVRDLLSQEGGSIENLDERRKMLESMMQQIKNSKNDQDNS